MYVKLKGTDKELQINLFPALRILTGLFISSSLEASGASPG